jgi:hypothetical protein
MPMRIIVSDSSCLIDLRKASLLDVFLRLPYEIVIPNTLFEEELIRFTDEQKEALVREACRSLIFRVKACYARKRSWGGFRAYPFMTASRSRWRKAILGAFF